jgi:hypothetical protein
MESDSLAKAVLSSHIQALMKLVERYNRYSDDDEVYLCRETADEICGKIEGLNHWLKKLNLIEQFNKAAKEIQ